MSRAFGRLFRVKDNSCKGSTADAGRVDQRLNRPVAVRRGRDVPLGRSVTWKNVPRLF